jgi:hypothetical protein
MSMVVLLKGSNWKIYECGAFTQNIRNSTSTFNDTNLGR